MGRPGSIEDIRPFAELAQNATTSVYKAYQASLERFVLLKRIRPTYSADEDLAARFQEEARFAARVHHPNVVSIFSFGRDEEGAYFVAEFVEGLDLARLIERAKIPPDLSLYILAKSARGLQAAHEKGVLHRDLKPANILISRDGAVKLSDFGLASVAGSTDEAAAEIRGTLAYLAPEQIRENAIDERSDLFSLGATFFEMLTGRRAFTGSGATEIFDAILNRDPLPYLSATAGVDEDVETICRRLLARNPSDRYGDARSVVDAAEACLRRRGAAIDAAVLSEFVEDPGAYRSSGDGSATDGRGGATHTPRGVWLAARGERPSARGERPSARGEGPSARGEGPSAELLQDRRPAVTVVPESAAPRRGATLQRLVAAATLVVAGALVYAGVALLGHQPASLGGAAVDSTALRAIAAADSVVLDADEEIDTADSSTDAMQERAGDAPAGRPDSADDEAVVDDAAPDDLLAEGEAEGLDVEDWDPPALPQTGFVGVVVDTTAAIFVDEESRGLAAAGSPLVVELEPGEHLVSLRNAIFPKADRNVVVASGDTVWVEHELWSTVGRLRLRVSPWADVYIDDEHVGQKTVFEPLVMKPGVYDVRMVHPLLNIDSTITVTLPPGETVLKDVDLTNLP